MLDLGLGEGGLRLTASGIRLTEEGDFLAPWSAVGAGAAVDGGVVDEDWGGAAAAPWGAGWGGGWGASPCGEGAGALDCFSVDGQRLNGIDFRKKKKRKKERIGWNYKLQFND